KRRGIWRRAPASWRAGEPDRGHRCRLSAARRDRRHDSECALSDHADALQISNARARERRASLSGKMLATVSEIDYFVAAQFRTCLWPCVDRWASGQEAGQPPKEAN